ncbi:hypothetical protein Aab01nite_78250 [Paractinoplanes abujensis]|uniref:Aminoglycoside phosphotransferase (APT) family kinase protein n=1 Tax=Paractinoplanes abujensis TaxID=882441 RepID=A0A7W7CS20_9ACTN|nr:phosphotransferase [Actinoplanes abujensis]MBB4692285.1 aminoglycoside phosphotransferase (APT) family kinase protein [Actinoplanes abujensis]GID24235.1 hypothetical protein Aab01nite_78250 [Actinoplanes abujensis]
MITWLPGPSVEALRAALRTVAPALAEGAIVPRRTTPDPPQGLSPSTPPEWRASTAVVDGRYVVKFAWAEPPARRIVHQARILELLRAAAPDLPLPHVVAVSHSPALLVTRRSPAVPFFDARHHLDTPTAARDLAAALATLHDTRALRAAVETLPAPTLPAATDHTSMNALRARLPALIRAGQRDRVLAWCDRADSILATPGRRVLVHGDFHGDNHLWLDGRLHLVIDWESAAVGEPEFDLRCLPSDCGPGLFLQTVTEYERLAGAPLDLERVMAWHLRAVLGDALWRAEAGAPLPGGGTPASWVDDLDARLTTLGPAWAG